MLIQLRYQYYNYCKKLFLLEHNLLADPLKWCNYYIYSKKNTTCHVQTSIEKQHKLNTEFEVTAYPPKKFNSKIEKSSPPHCHCPLPLKVPCS